MLPPCVIMEETEQNVRNKAKLKEQNIAIQVGAHVPTSFLDCFIVRPSFNPTENVLTPKLIPNAQSKVCIICTLWINQHGVFEQEMIIIMF